MLQKRQSGREIGCSSSNAASTSTITHDFPINGRMTQFLTPHGGWINARIYEEFDHEVDQTVINCEITNCAGCPIRVGVRTSIEYARTHCQPDPITLEREQGECEIRDMVPQPGLAVLTLAISLIGFYC
jgi:hypothetical protein